MSSLFGLPIYHDSIDPSEYDRDNIIAAIKRNFDIDPNRNNWDSNGDYTSKLHHEIMDTGNIQFEKIDYSSLTPVYSRHAARFLEQQGFMNKGISAELSIVNYTCMQSSNYLKEHVHYDYFSGVHYIKFDQETHPPTYFSNPADHVTYTQMVSPLFLNCLENTVENSWIYDYTKMDVRQDDIVMWPSMLKHYVPPFVSDELRMTIAFNIRLYKEQ